MDGKPGVSFRRGSTGQQQAVLTGTGSDLTVRPREGWLSPDEAQWLTDPAVAQARPGPGVSGPAFLPPDDVCRRFWASDAYGRVVLGRDGTIRWVNATAAAMVGYPIHEVIGSSMARFVAAEDVAVAIEAVAETHGELSDGDEGVPLVLGLTRADGSVVHVEIGAQSLLDVPELGAISLRVRPYDSQRYLERFLIDLVAGIPNRSQFFASLEVSMGTTEPGRLGVLYLDLDGFKPVNDNHGHRFGDRLLAEIGALLGANVRPGDMVARLGGDEFAVLCSEVGGEAELCEVAARLIEVVSQPLVLDGIEVSISVSIGVAVAKVHGHTHDEVLDSADAALYHAKRAGRGRYSVAVPA